VLPVAAQSLGALVADPPSTDPVTMLLARRRDHRACDSLIGVGLRGHGPSALRPGTFLIGQLLGWPAHRQEFAAGCDRPVGLVANVRLIALPSLGVSRVVLKPPGVPAGHPQTMSTSQQLLAGFSA